MLASIIPSIFWSKLFHGEVSVIEGSIPFFARLMWINGEIVIFSEATFSWLIKYGVYLNTYYWNHGFKYKFIRPCHDFRCPQAEKTKQEDKTTVVKGVV